MIQGAKGLLHTAARRRLLVKKSLSRVLRHIFIKTAKGWSGQLEEIMEGVYTEASGNVLVLFTN